MISLIALVLALLTLVFPNATSAPEEPVPGAEGAFTANGADDTADLAAILGSWEATISFPGGEERETSMTIQQVATDGVLDLGTPWLAIGPQGEALAGALTLGRTDAGLHLACDARGSSDRAVLQGHWVQGTTGGYLEGTLFGVDYGRLFHWKAVRAR